MYEIETLKNGIKKCEENILMIEGKMNEESKRKNDYLSDSISQDPQYSKEMIKQEIGNIDNNLNSMREVIKLDRKKITEYKIHLENSERILRQHGENPNKY